MLEQKITRRIVMLAMLACVVGALGAVGAGLIVSRELGIERMRELVVDSGTQRARAACSGSRYAFGGPGGVAYRAFDDAGRALDGGTALSPDDMRADGTIAHGAHRVTRLVFEIDHAGRCRWIEAQWQPREGARRTFWLAVGVVTLGLLVLVVVMVRRLVASPLLDRLATLRAAAAKVGTDRYAPAPVWGDEMDAIARALDGADRNAKERLEGEAAHARSLDSFVADVAHDVRTPLASLALALDEIAEESPETAMPALRRALNDVVYLGSLTQNLGLVRQMSRGTPNDSVSALDLLPIVRRVVQRAEPFALRRGIALVVTLEEAPHVRASELASEQAITNLVENAVAHGEAGNEVRVTLAARPEEIEIAIDDDGEGVAEADLARLGERSFRTDRARTRDQRGTGLGLSITRTVAERSGWSLSFARSDRGGLRAVLRVPLDRDTSSTNAAQARET